MCRHWLNSTIHSILNILYSRLYSRLQSSQEGGWAGYDYYERELQSYINYGRGSGSGSAGAGAGAAGAGAAPSCYTRVLMTGDSMGR